MMKEAHNMDERTNNQTKPSEQALFIEKVNSITCLGSLLRTALCSQMESLIELKDSGFFSDICDNSIDALKGVIDGAILVQNKQGISINRGLERFVEALNAMLQSYLFTDSSMLEFLSANAEVYGVRNKLAFEYAGFISNCIRILESEQEKEQRTKYLFKPCLSSSVSVTRIWDEDPPICIINIPTEMMLNSPKRLLFRIAHEVSHYAGRKYRMCIERNEVAKEICTIVFVAYTIDYLNSQIGQSNIEETNRIKEERKMRILNAIKNDREDVKTDKKYSAFCKSLLDKFSDIVNSVDFITAFNLGLRSPGTLYSGNESTRIKEHKEAYFKNVLRNNAIRIMDFFLQIIKECIADLLSAKILDVSDIQYLEIMSSSGSNEDEKGDAFGDFDSFCNLVRKLLVAEVIRGESKFGDESINIITTFKFPFGDKPMTNWTDAILGNFIKFFIWNNELGVVFAFLKSIYAQYGIEKENQCKKMFDRVKQNNHSDDYYTSII